MIRILIIGIVLLFGLISCSDDTVLIELTDHIQFTWNNTQQKIEEDADFKNIQKHFLIYRKTIINQIANTEKTEVRICKSHTNITNGVMAFVLLDYFEDIPYYLVFQLQFDAYGDCRYPHGLIPYIAREKEEVVEKLHFYFQN
ncbi:MAG: hypothetical protein GQ574_15470 [Crocinitomix sp.]|nr:hypothetical protein [Crocinitomix sp.]